jgi:Fe2+ or Zn2+ uptake regulation protein
MKKPESGLPKDLKKTKPRQAIFNALEKADFPQNAFEIFSAVRENGEDISLSTVYRTLDVLTRKGVVSKTTFPGSETAVYELIQKQHKHYALCMGCHQVTLMENCPMEAFQPLLKEKGFQITGHKIELYGYCHACAKRE